MIQRKASKMEHKSIQSARGEVHYWISRSEKHSKTLVFTHGLTANHEMFEKQVEFFKQSYHIIVWDVPLHGLSRPYTDFSYRNCAEELHAILEAEAIEKVVLVGMSMGGYPSQMFGAMYPERTQGFVALDTTPFGLAYYSKSDIWWLKRVGAMAGWFSNAMLRISMAKSVSRTQYSHDKMITMLKPLTKEDIVTQMDIAYRGFIQENQDVSFGFPVLILLGEHDKTGKVQSYCKRWAQNTGYPLVIIKDAAHFSNGDNPRQVNAAILEFIQTL